MTSKKLKLPLALKICVDLLEINYRQIIGVANLFLRIREKTVGVEGMH
jgi:hypothetical protein